MPPRAYRPKAPKPASVETMRECREILAELEEMRAPEWVWADLTLIAARYGAILRLRAELIDEEFRR